MFVCLSACLPLSQISEETWDFLCKFGKTVDLDLIFMFFYSHVQSFTKLVISMNPMDIFPVNSK